MEGLIETKNEYIEHMQDIITIPISKKIYEIWCDCSKRKGSIKEFQKELIQIKKWNNNIIDEEYKRIVKSSKCKYLADLIKIIIITNDGDYLQMYSNNVKIFNMQLKDLSLKINYNPAIELLLKIIMGDKSDNIPKIQAGMRKDNALKIALMSEDDRIKYLTLHNMLDNFNLNKNLIDLDEIPEIIVKNFYEYYNISIQ